jgi:hypothetical protein
MKDQAGLGERTLSIVGIPRRQSYRNSLIIESWGAGLKFHADKAPGVGGSTEPALGGGPVLPETPTNRNKGPWWSYSWDLFTVLPI